MRCGSKIKRLCLMNREEMTARQAERLQHHMDRCPDCRKRRQEWIRTREYVESLGRMVPELKDQRKFAEQVLESLESEKTSRDSFFGRSIEEMPKIRSGIRWVMAGITVILCSGFLFQQSALLVHLKRLETSMNQHQNLPERYFSRIRQLETVWKDLLIIRKSPMRSSAKYTTRFIRKEEIYVLLDRYGLSLSAVQQKRLIYLVKDIKEDLDRMEQNESISIPEKRLFQRNRSRILEFIERIQSSGGLEDA